MTRFSGLQITLHWLTLALVAVTCAAMEIHGWFPKGSVPYLAVKAIHYNAGVLVWLLMVFRLMLKRVYKAPAIIPAPPAWQAKAAGLMHIVLFILFLTLPVLGVFTMALGGERWACFGITVSPFVAPDHPVKSVVKGIHETLANAGYFLIALHAAAALFHHYIQRDNTLRRMMPGHSRWR
ncbi:cytochrome b [Salmonella enterica subsp. enterica serovar Infantis]|nr:cytochrome b [Salmonella enterica subsp. enterica serovar Infantis]